MMKKMVAAGAVFVSLTPAFAGTRLVIDELRKLKSSLPINDSSRNEVALRLADRLADEALIRKDQAPAQAEADRLEAITLYQENLNHRVGEAQIKIKFQLARLNAENTSDANAIRTAKSLFQEVGSTAQARELKRESFLRLAEFAENSAPADAVGYYRQALTLCEGTDSCSYSHYRLSWIERNRGQINTAIEEMKLALWDSKGQIREEALRDLISLIGMDTAQVDAGIVYLDQLATKLNRPTLLTDLAYAYFASGAKAAGVKVLALTHSRAPSMAGAMRLLEEYYGLRQWDQFKATLSGLETAPMGTNEKEVVESEKIGRRLATQLDGERTTDPTRFEDFQKFTLAYLNLFPKSADAPKVMEGLVAATKDVDTNLNQIRNWLADSRFAMKLADEIRLRELRVGIAQKAAETDAAKNTVVIEEMDSLMVKNPSKSRDYRYVRARAAYAMKNHALAIPEFESLATVQGDPDAYAIQSQHLLLDIFNQQKDLPRLIQQAKAWTANPAYQKNQKIAGDLKEMNQIADQAGFESAIARGETNEALEQFLNYCREGRFLPQSCDNAKVLSVKLGRHPQLIEVLELLAKQDPKIHLPTLADEYENGAYFGKAADLMTKLGTSTSDFKTGFKMALLHEVNRNPAGRDSVLKEMRKQYGSRKLKVSAEEEKALLAFFNDARLLDASMIAITGIPEMKAFIAENLEEQQLGNKLTAQTLLGFNAYQGVAWANLVTAQADALARSADQIGFHGRNGQVAFQKRVNRIRELNQFADRYLSGADSLTRTKLLAVLKTSHEKIGNEILQSPMPAGLSEEQLDQIRNSLAEMAKPFLEKVDVLSKLLQEETMKVSMTQSGASVAFDDQGYRQSIEALHLNPKNRESLIRLKSIFDSAGQVRPAAYFEGRIQSL